MLKRVITYIIALLMVTAVSVSAQAQNILANPGFEEGAAGGGARPYNWNWFGNAYQEGTYDPFYPHTGSQLCSMYGNFSGSFNVSGIFQEYTCSEGDSYEMACWARYSSNDPMIGSQAEGGNWMVQKIAFFDAGNNEIGAVESIILDGSFAADTWHYSGGITGTAPANTVKVQALVLYLQPSYDGGAGHVDDVAFGPAGTVDTENASWGEIKSRVR